MRAIITGGCGFIGSNLADALIDCGHEVIVIDNLITGRERNVKHLFDNPKFTLHKADIIDFNSIKSIFKDIDWVFHLAGMADIVPSIESPSPYYESNVTGTFNVLESARLSGVKKIVYASSSSCYGIPTQYPTTEESEIRPQYPYALTKYMGEELVMHWSQIYNIPAISLRLFNVYGPRSRTTGAYGAVFGVFLAQKNHNKPYTVVGDGSQTRDFVYISDVVSAFIKAAESSNLKGTILNVGSGSHYSINSLVSLLKGEVVNIPKRPGEPDISFANITKIQQELDWKPQVNFKDGVTKMLEHLDDWKDAPVWNPDKIKEATSSWFEYLS